LKIFKIFTDAPDCPACDEAIKQLEQIDDDTDAVGVKFVKTDDADFATEFGITEFPAILYFEDKEPSIYDGEDFWGSIPYKKKLNPNKQFRSHTHFKIFFQDF
jgi:thiol-disulfide isomerase/thioredoxin